jgi:hypothetical protein
MKFVAESHNTGDPSTLIAEESEGMARLQQQGLVERVMLKADWSGAILIMEAPDRVTAQDAADALPLSRHGITSFTLTEVIDPAEAMGSPT